MTITEAGLDSFGQLAKAIGLLDQNGQPNTSWFGDPVGAAGTSGNQHGLRHLLADNDQRTALMGFVDEVLGPPDRAESAGTTWVPLFAEANPHVTIYAVVGTDQDQVHLGVGLEHTTAGDLPRVSTRLHVPVFRFAKRGRPAILAAGGLPPWLLLGNVGGRVELRVEAVFTKDPPTPGEASLAGVAVTLGVPTTTDDHLALAFELRDLQLPGATEPRTFSFDASSLEELGTDVFDLLAGLVRAQADSLSGTDPTLARFRAVAGLLGLRDVPNLPPLPLAALATQGLPALVGWVEGVLGSSPARLAWLGELKNLVGGTVVPADNAVRIAIGNLEVTIGLRVLPGSAGHPVLVPWADVGLDIPGGGRVRLAADLLRADTGTAAFSALPDLRLEAVFGVDGGATALLPGTAPHVGSLHTGIALDPTGRPAFFLTLRDVDVTAGGPHHDFLDLSTPSAALDSAASVIEGAVADAIDDLGPAGELVNRLLGLSPPAGVTALDVSALLADPLGAVRDYWQAVLANAAAAADVLGRLRALVTGAPAAPVPGSGTLADPWVVELATGVELQVWRDGSTLVADLVGQVSVPVLEEHAVKAALGLTLVRSDLSSGHTAFGVDAHVALSLARQDGQTASLSIGAVTLEVDEILARVSWAPAQGLRALLAADGLAVAVPGPTNTTVGITLPTYDPMGRLTIPAPDWSGIENVLAALLAETRLPVVDALLGLVGWNGEGAHLSLAGLLGADPGAAVEAWFADLLLDCDRVRFAMGPVAALLSGFTLGAPLGAGSARDPFRAPVAGVDRAPGLAVWLDPNCAAPRPDLREPLGALALSEPPQSPTVVALLTAAAPTLPDVADLLVGRDSLAAGFDLLVSRWTGTDGIVGRPASLPTDVTGVDLSGTYAELVALGSFGTLLDSVMDPVPAAVVHVGCEATWVTDRPTGTAFDRSGNVTLGTVPATGDGTWFVRLPTPSAAAVARPDRGAVGEQAARLAAVLADRTDPVVLVGYGASGAAAVRAATSAAAVSDVVTVGSPWGAVAVDSLGGGLGGDALRLLTVLRRRDHTTWPDDLLGQEATPREQMYALVERSRDVLAARNDLPSVATETPRSGLGVHAVFGVMDEDSLRRGLGAYVSDGVQARVAALPTVDDSAVRTGLHAGLSIPVVDLDLGGLLVGVGATVELLRIGRATPGPGLDASLVRGVVLDVHLGVHDGWLAGGPGSASTVGDLRWMSARIDVPLDGREGDAELVLHEAKGFGIDRERWVVRADPAGAAPDVPLSDITAAVPEVRVLLSDVVARLSAASTDLGALLGLLGLTRNGGLDPDGLDRLLHDTATTLRPLVAAGSTAIATKLRSLVPQAGGAGTTLTWTVGPATLGLDLAAGTLTAALQVASPGMPPIKVDVAMTATGASATAAVGTIDAHSGGLRLVAATAPSATVAVEWAGPGSAPRHVALLPEPDVPGLGDLATVLLPAVLSRGLLDMLRATVSSEARPVLEASLDAVGLLTDADALGNRAVVVPIGLVQDPGGWLRHGVDVWRTDPAGSAVTFLESLAPLIVPDRGSADGWPIADGVVLRYSVEPGNRLQVLLDVSMEIDAGSGTTVTTSLAGGLLIGPDALPQPTLEVSVDVDGRGLRLDVAPGSTPPVRLVLLRATPVTPLPLYPDGPGLGDALTAVGESVMPVVLNAIAAHRTDAALSALKSVGQAVFDLGTALDLLDGTAFSAPRLTTFAINPAARLEARLPQLVSTAVATVAHAVDPGGSLVAVTPSNGKVTLGFGGGRKIKLVLDASGAVPAVEVQADLVIDGVGRFVLDRLRVSSAGVEVAAQLGPLVLDLGAFSLRPLVVVRAGSAAGSERLVGLGLALDDAAVRSVQFRWALDADPPDLVAVTRTQTGESPGTAAEAAQWLLALALSLAGGVLVDGLRDVLTPKATATLQGVVFTDTPASTQIDPQLAIELLDPAALLVRLKRLLWNAAQTPALSITLEGVVTIGLASTGTTTKALGVNVSLLPGRRFTMVDGDTRVELEVDASWVHPTVAAGLSIYVLEGASSNALIIQPGVSVAGLGLRFTKTIGPLLSLGAISIDGIAVQVYGEATGAGAGGGVNLELAGFALSPGGGAGGNGVANSIMNDAGKASPSSRPAFSPSIAVQKHPGLDATVSLRAGPPPGPWWTVVQRQLGPLYLERVGLNTVETNGTVSRISLMFDGRVSIFGLTASVDQLSISWTGGDVLNIEHWAVDLMGLAISADMSGVSIAGGILKTGGPPSTEPISYVGMLLGRFGVYGLSIFGGYTNDNGNPSFFVFGGINGPIGGPPAFFLTGIGGGLGINRGLKIPEDMTHFNEFPFIQALDPAAKPPAEPMAELRKLNDYFPVQRGNFWFAAGISFNSFTLVDGIAVIAVSFGDGLEINLLGLARVALPRPQAALVSIELGLLARFSTREGVFMIRAGLTENSWLLYREVRLTGGFAFAFWWKGPLAGQFVMTLGGYHPDFHRDGYPQVPRLGLVWQVSDAIVIKGGSYFALTSEALMAGVDVEVSADFGWAWARVAFGAHGIVYFDPFWFEVMAYARISAGVKIHTFFGTISFSISLGASVKVWGPEFSGVAKFEVGPCTVTVPFGSEHKVEPQTLGWAEFVAKYLEDAGQGHARALSAITGRGTLPAATGGSRSAPTSDGTSARPFEVYAEFEISFVTTVPTAKLDLALTTGAVNVPVTRSDGLAAHLGLKPMRAGNLDSTLHIVLEHKEGSNYTAIPEQLRLLAANLAAATPRPEGSGFGRDAYPIGAWGAPDPAGLPAPPLPKGDVVFAGNLVRLVAEAQSFHRGPEIDYYKVEASRRPLPLQASGSSRTDLLTEAAGVPVVSAATALQALTAARQRLFASVPASVPAGLLPVGPRSALARAAYFGETAAPPLFGTLADGMAPDNATDASAERFPPATREVTGKVRTAVLTGFLAAGAGVAGRATRTSVSDGRVKRRVAPTVDSVQARLGAHLPLQLHSASAPSVEHGETVVSREAPRTVVTGAVRSYSLGSSGLTGLVGGLGDGFAPAPKRSRRKGLDESRALEAGDVVVLRLPDHSVDTGTRRPVLDVDGQARVTVLGGDGSVLLGAPVQGKVAIPAGAAIVAVRGGADSDAGADPGPTGSTEGLAGWHGRSRVCALGSHAALAAGCVVTADGGPTTQGVIWTTAAELLGDSAAIRTIFDRSVRTIAVVLEAGDADRLDGLELELTGADRARDLEGLERPPVVVLGGGQSVLVFAIEPQEGSPVGVRVRAGGDWKVTGVLGGDQAPDAVAAAVVRRGVVAATGRLLATPGSGARLTWHEAPQPPTDAPKATVKKATVKKPTVKKATVKKPSVKKATAKKATAKKATAKKATANKATAKKTAKKTTAKGRGAR